jgi:hypothetical protein
MTLIKEAQQQADKIQQTFLTRLNQLFDDINYWVADRHWQTEYVPTMITEKVIGTYTVPSLTILTNSRQKVVDIVPKCAFVIVAEGIVSINGTMSSEHLAYLCATEQSIYPISKDHWYWIDYSHQRNRAYLINKQLFFNLLDKVTHSTD